MPQKILVLHTGGTISMQADATGAVVTSQDNPMNHVSSPRKGLRYYTLTYQSAKPSYQTDYACTLS